MLAACTQLRNLRLAGGTAHGNPICQLPALHLALAAVLPQVTAVDSAPECAIVSGCMSGSPVDAQVLAALQLKAFQASMPVSHKPVGIPDQAPAYHKSCTAADGDCKLSQEEHGYDDGGLSVRNCSSCGAAPAPRPAPACGAAAPGDSPRPVTAAAARPAVSGYSRRRPQLVAPASPPRALCMHVGVQTTTTSNELRKLQVMLRGPGRYLASRWSRTRPFTKQLVDVSCPFPPHLRTRECMLPPSSCSSFGVSAS